MTPKNNTELHIKRCLRMIEERLQWGASDNWANYDFTKLSDEVHNRTQVRLSVTTLKRVWGRLKYDSAPTLTTLNALAQFAGSSDWRHFCREDNSIADAGIHQVATSEIPSIAGRPRSYWPLLAVPAVAIIALVILQAKERSGVDHDRFQFKADKMVTDGVPNSVVFHYDATAAETDSVFIVQTWDIRRKKVVDRTNHEHSAIYYYPGFFNTKLIVGTEIVKTHELWITSNGWLGLVEQEPVPLYFKRDEYVFADRVEVSEQLLSKYNLTLNPSPPKVRFFNQQNLGDIMNDNFAFETKVKAPFDEGAGACQLVQVLIQCKNDIIAIPLGAKGCVGQMELYFCGAHFPSTDANLSGFGRDLNEWTHLRVESVEKDVAIFVDGEKVYSFTFPNRPTGVVGVQYRFNGLGAVKDTWFESNGNVVPL
jgi:hypothetical protein